MHCLLFLIFQLQKNEILKEIHVTMKIPDRAKTQNSKLKQNRILNTTLVSKSKQA